MHVRRQRLSSVTGLGLFHVANICRVEELRPIDDQPELRFRTEHLLDAFRGFTLPVWSCDHVTTSIVSGRAATNVPVIKRVHVRQLHGIVAALLHFRDAKYDGLGPKIDLQHGVGRVAIGRDDSSVLRREYSRFVHYVVERTFVLRVGFVNVELIQSFVRRDHWKAVDVSLLKGVFVGHGLANGFLVLTARHASEKNYECDDWAQFSDFHLS